MKQQIELQPHQATIWIVRWKSNYIVSSKVELNCYNSHQIVLYTTIKPTGLPRVLIASGNRRKHTIDSHTIHNNVGQLRTSVVFFTKHQRILYELALNYLYAINACWIQFCDVGWPNCSSNKATNGTYIVYSFALWNCFLIMTVLHELNPIFFWCESILFHGNGFFIHVTYKAMHEKSCYIK